jgi:hypothetical protein
MTWEDYFGEVSSVQDPPEISCGIAQSLVHDHVIVRLARLGPIAPTWIK